MVKLPSIVLQQVIERNDNVREGKGEHRAEYDRSGCYSTYALQWTSTVHNRVEEESGGGSGGSGEKRRNVYFDHPGLLYKSQLISMLQNVVE